MPQTATVTARVADLGAAPRAGWIPVVWVSFPTAGVTFDGTVVMPEPVRMTESSGGQLSIQLILSEEIQDAKPYRAEVQWQSPSTGASLKSHVLNFVVPDGGGTLGDLTLVETHWGMAWVGTTPPPVSMLWLFMDPDFHPDGWPVPTYQAPNGVLEHGDLVDWEA